MTKLMINLRDFLQVPDFLIQSAKILDKFYIPPRYPNGFDEGAPSDYFTAGEAEEAIKNAQKIIEFCGRHIC